MWQVRILTKDRPQKGSGKVQSSRIRKTVSERNTLLESTDMRISPMEISLTDAARRASASGHPGLNHIKRLISCNQSLLIQVRAVQSGRESNFGIL